MGLSRRNFIVKFFLSALGLLLLDSFWFERYIIQWTEFDISEIRTDSIKIIQLTDLHIDKIKYFHKSIAKRINEEKPDLITITGDSVNYTSKLPALDSFLKLIDPEIKMVAIMGNKEYAGNVKIDALSKLYERYNGRLLINENHGFSSKGRDLNIVGIDDFIGGSPDFELSTKYIDKRIDTVILNHCPEYSDEISVLNKNLGLRIKLILSGHTHGGQIAFLGKELYKPGGSGRFLKGWYNLNGLKMYVSKGIGTTIFPFRLGARAEATIFYV